jgi:hypothetical protein
MIISPLEASATFATLVGLICNWKQERGTLTTDQYQDFMKWLAQHNFNKLSDRIFASEELQRDLSAFLSQDISVISTKLDTIVGSLSAVANKIDTLSQLRRTLGADTEALSEQAIEILKAFDESASINMIYQGFSHELIFPCCQKSARVSEPRFIENDLSALQKFHYIQLVGHTPKGAEKFAMTRLGCHFVKTIKESTLNKHETNDSLSV